MLDMSMPQPVTASCDLFVKAGRRTFLTEPDLGELLRDPMFEALMAADHVDRRELCALIAQMREHLAPMVAGARNCLDLLLSTSFVPERVASVKVV